MRYNPEQFPLVGPERDHPFAEENARIVVTNPISYANEVSPTPEEAAEILRVHASIGIMGDELGVDLRGRLPRPGEEMRHTYHFFDDPEAFAAVVRDRFGPDAEIPHAIYFPGNGVLYLRPKGPFEPDMFRSIFMHENGHLVGRAALEPALKHSTKADGTPDIKMSFKSHLTYDLLPNRGFGESVTDMAAERQSYILGGRYFLTYPGVDALLDGAVQKAAEAHGMSPKELGNLILKGAHTGDLTGLRLLKEKMPPDHFRILTSTEGNESNETCLKIARALGFDSAVAILEADEPGDRLFGAWNKPAKGFDLQLPAGQPQTDSGRERIMVIAASKGAAGAAPESVLGQAATIMSAELDRVGTGLGELHAIFTDISVTLETVQAVADGSERLQLIAGVLDRAKAALGRACTHGERGWSDLDDYLKAIGMGNMR